MAKKGITRPSDLEHTPANCHAREMLARVGDKWSVYVIHVLGDAGTLQYALTRLGRTLRQLVRGLVDWSGAHLAEVHAARTAYDARNRRSAKPVRSDVRRWFGIVQRA